MSEARKEDVFGFGYTMRDAQEMFQNLSKAQSDFMMETFSKGMTYHKEQSELVTRIVQNQMNHGSVILQSYLRVVNSNMKPSESKK